MRKNAYLSGKGLNMNLTFCWSTVNYDYYVSINEVK